MGLNLCCFRSGPPSKSGSKQTQAQFSRNSQDGHKLSSLGSAHITGESRSLVMCEQQEPLAKGYTILALTVQANHSQDPPQTVSQNVNEEIQLKATKTGPVITKIFPKMSNTYILRQNLMNSIRIHDRDNTQHLSARMLPSPKSSGIQDFPINKSSPSSFERLNTIDNRPISLKHIPLMNFAHRGVNRNSRRYTLKSVSPSPKNSSTSQLRSRKFVSLGSLPNVQPSTPESQNLERSIPVNSRNHQLAMSVGFSSIELSAEVPAGPHLGQLDTTLPPYSPNRAGLKQKVLHLPQVHTKWTTEHLKIVKCRENLKKIDELIK